MTIAAGFLCKHGVLLCADTEHSAYPLKVHESKIGRFEVPAGTIGFAYAGNVGFARSAIQKCKRGLRNAKPADLLDRLEAVLDREYRRNVLKHPDHSTDSLIPYRILLAVRPSNEDARLFVTTQTALEEVDTGFYSIGTGDYLFNYLVASCAQRGMEDHHALSLAAYALAAIKQNVEGCGGMSIFIDIRNDGLSPLLTSRHPGICTWVDSFTAAFDHQVRRLMIAISNPMIDDAHVERYLHDIFSRSMLETRKR